MIIEIEEKAACDPREHKWLDRILNKIEDGWHIWDFTGQEDYKKTSWVAERGTKGDSVMELFQACVSRSAWTKSIWHGRRVRVTCHPRGNNDLIPQKAARLADEQLVILVENRESDGDFIRRVAKELDPALLNWMKQEPQPCRIDSVGGKGQMNIEVEKCGAKVPRPRLVVIVDSDKRHPDDTPSKEAKTLRKRCYESGFSCWILAKRESENYLPGELLRLRQDVGADYRIRVDVWERLTNDQKDFFNMKDGLSENPKPQEEKLFGSLSETDKKVLSNGFGTHVAKCWNEHRGDCRAALAKRGGQELIEGIGLIKKEV